MYIIKEEGMKGPAKIWAEKGSIEEGCIEQVKNITEVIADQIDLVDILVELTPLAVVKG
jgi:hypothetical protein